jgi:hypothetical protein
MARNDLRPLSEQRRKFLQGGPVARPGYQGCMCGRMLFGLLLVPLDPHLMPF